MKLKENIDYKSLEELIAKLNDKINKKLTKGYPLDIINKRDYAQIFVDAAGGEPDLKDEYNFAINIYTNGDIDWLYPGEEEAIEEHYEDEDLLISDINDFIEQQSKTLDKKLSEKVDLSKRR